MARQRKSWSRSDSPGTAADQLLRRAHYPTTEAHTEDFEIPHNNCSRFPYSVRTEPKLTGLPTSCPADKKDEEPVAGLAVTISAEVAGECGAIPHARLAVA